MARWQIRGRLSFSTHSIVTAVLCAAIVLCGFMGYRRWFKVTAESNEAAPKDAQTVLWISAVGILGVILALW